MRPRKRQTAAASFALLVLSPWLPEPTHAASPSTSSTEIRERLRRTAESALLAVQEQRRVKVELESAAATELHKYIDACA